MMHINPCTGSRYLPARRCSWRPWSHGMSLYRAVGAGRRCMHSRSERRRCLCWNLSLVTRAEISGGSGLSAHGATCLANGEDEAVPCGRGRGRHVRARCSGTVSVRGCGICTRQTAVRMEGRGSGDAGVGRLAGSTLGCHPFAFL